MDYSVNFICDASEGSGNSTRGISTSGKTKSVSLNTSQIKEQMSNLFGAVGEMFDSSPLTTSPFDIDEIEFRMTISTEGTVSILSTIGGSISASSGITVKLKKKNKVNEK